MQKLPRLLCYFYVLDREETGNWHLKQEFLSSDIEEKLQLDEKRLPLAGKQAKFSPEMDASYNNGKHPHNLSLPVLISSRPVSRVKTLGSCKEILSLLQEEVHTKISVGSGQYKPAEI